VDAATGYCRPRSIDQAIAFKADAHGHAVFLAGGTDLMLRLPKPYPGLLIDLGSADLADVTRAGNLLLVGAMVTAQRLVSDPLIREHAPLIRDAAIQLGSPQVRSRATIGGNVINASPAADLTCALVALEATAILRGPQGSRRVSVLDLAIGPGRTVCAAEELLAGFELPIRSGRSCFWKLGLRAAQSIAVASVAVNATIQSDGRTDRVTIACGSVAPHVVRAHTVEKCLAGAVPGLRSLEEAARLVLEDIAPISDVRGSAAYRRAATVGILRRALGEVLSCA